MCPVSMEIQRIFKIQKLFDKIAINDNSILEAMERGENIHRYADELKCIKMIVSMSAQIACMQLNVSPPNGEQVIS